jgi:hypothetical protein
MIILCHSHHGVHVFIPGRATVLSGEGMGSNTYVHDVSYAWAPMITPHLAGA